MTDLQINRHEMHKTVLQALDAHADAWAAVPAVQTLRDRLDALVETTRDAARAQGRSPKGATSAKGALRAKVAKKSWQLAQALVAWARANNRPDVEDAIAMSKTEFNALRDVALAEYSEIVVAEAREHLPAEGEDPTTGLGAQGVTAAFVDQLDALDDQFAEDIATPRSALNAKKDAGKTLATAVRQAQRLLKKELDPTVDFLAPEHPAFAEAYRNARIIVDRGRGRSGAMPDDESDA